MSQADTYFYYTILFILLISIVINFLALKKYIKNKTHQILIGIFTTILTFIILTIIILNILGPSFFGYSCFMCL